MVYYSGKSPTRKINVFQILREPAYFWVIYISQHQTKQMSSIEKRLVYVISCNHYEYFNQLEHGKKYYNEEKGKNFTSFLFCVRCFGFSAQIMKYFDKKHHTFQQKYFQCRCLVAMKCTAKIIVTLPVQKKKTVFCAVSGVFAK